MRIIFLTIFFLFHTPSFSQDTILLKFPNINKKDKIKVLVKIIDKYDNVYSIVPSLKEDTIIFNMIKDAKRINIIIKKGCKSYKFDSIFYNSFRPSQHWVFSFNKNIKDFNFSSDYNEKYKNKVNTLEIISKGGFGSGFIYFYFRKKKFSYPFNRKMISTE